MIGIIFLLLNINVEWQTDWVGGSGVAGPVSDWGNKFWQSDSVTYNIQGQVSPRASGTPNYTNWTKRTIDTDANIAYNAIWPADFDNDGDMDLAGWKSVSGQLVFYRNNSNTFTQATTMTGPVGSYWSFMYGADLDNDTKTDVVVCGGETGKGVYWYKNNGGFSFTKNTITTDSCCFFVEGADIDKDGYIDLGITRAFVGGVEIWHNNKNGTFSLWQTLSGLDSWRIKLGDLNGDSYPDVVIGDGYTILSSEISYKIFFNDGTGHFNVAATVANGASTTTNDGLWIRDVNNDGKNDIITALIDNSSGPTSVAIYWFENDGTGVNYTQHTVYPGGNIFYGDGGFAEDIDMDGKADVPTGWTHLSWFRQNNSDSWTEYVIDQPTDLYTHWIVPFKTEWGQCFESAKINLLVSWRGASTGSFVWYENNIVSGFVASASLQSSILRSSECDTTTWLQFGWKTCCPFDNAISFQFRSGKDYSSITSALWSTPVVVTAATSIDSVDLSSYVQNGSGDSLFQYKVGFVGASDAGILDSVWVTYHCGIAGVAENKTIGKEGLSIYANKILYSLPKDTEVRLALYDVSGRLAKLLDEGKKSQGDYTANIPKLSNGIYLVVLKAGEKIFSKKITVIK
ncbi:MAG: T9SS type A sorting domain-containing protein [bacterium]|nr:T9SS type A sorting domain-containing protein [bacterium]